MEESKEPFVDMENLKIGEIKPVFSEKERQLIWSAQLETLEDIKQCIDFYKEHKNHDIVQAVSDYIDYQIKEKTLSLQLLKNK